MNDHSSVRAVSPARQRRQAGAMARRIAVMTGDYMPSPFRVWTKRILLGILILGIALPAFGAFVFYLIYSNLVIPTPEDIPTGKASVVLYSDNDTEIAEFAPVNREIIDTSTLPEYVSGVLAHAVDPDFDTREPGSFWELGAVALGTKADSHNTTIAGQYVSRYYHGERIVGFRAVETTLLRLKVERAIDKDTLLDYFLNTAYFGRGAYGVAAASKAYFGHPAEQLTVGESLILAAVLDPANPGDPESHADYYTEAFEAAPATLGDHPDLASAAQSATFPKIVPSFERSNATWGQSAGYIMDRVRAELYELHYSKELVEVGGLTIRTTVDVAAQKVAVSAAKAMDRVEGWTSKPHRLAIVDVDTHAGAIRAMYGGADYHRQPVNTATAMRAPVGTAVLPYALIANAQANGSVEDVYPAPSAEQLTENPTIGIDDVNAALQGEATLTSALQKSTYPTLLRMNERLGANHTYEAALAAGLPLEEERDATNTANILGQTPASAEEIAAAFATVATGQKQHAYVVVQSVHSHDGAVFYEHKTSAGGQEVFDGQTLSAIYPALKKSLLVGPQRKSIDDNPNDMIGMTGKTHKDASAQLVAATPDRVLAISMFRQDENGKVRSLEGIGGLRTFAEGYWQTKVWADYASQAWATASMGSYTWLTDVQRPAATYLPIPQPAPEQPTPTPEPDENTTVGTTPDSDVTGGQTSPEPAPESAPAPAPAPEPAPEPPQPADPQPVDPQPEPSPVDPDSEG